MDPIVVSAAQAAAHRIMEHDDCKKFDPVKYGHVKVVELSDENASGSLVSCDDDENDSASAAPQQQQAATKPAAAPRRRFRVHFYYSLISVSGDSIPGPPCSLDIHAEIGTPGNSMGWSGAGGDAANAAKTWEEYEAAARPIIESVLAALPSSEYLGFSIQHCDWGEDSMSITVGGDQETGRTYDVSIRGSHTNGYGKLNAATGKWSELHHRHKRPCRRSEGGDKEVFSGPPGPLFPPGWNK